MTEWLPVTFTAANIETYVGVPLASALGYTLLVERVGVIGDTQYYDVLRQGQTFAAWHTAEWAAVLLNRMCAAIRQTNTEEPQS
jgi:hypothetical protein